VRDSYCDVVAVVFLVVEPRKQLCGEILVATNELFSQPGTSHFLYLLVSGIKIFSPMCMLCELQVLPELQDIMKFFADDSI